MLLFGVDHFSDRFLVFNSCWWTLTVFLTGYALVKYVKNLDLEAFVALKLLSSLLHLFLERVKICCECPRQKRCLCGELSWLLLKFKVAWSFFETRVLLVEFAQQIGAFGYRHRLLLIRCLSLRLIGRFLWSFDCPSFWSSGWRLIRLQYFKINFAFRLKFLYYLSAFLVENV